MGEEVKLSAPWVTYYKEIEALFGEDPDIKVELDQSAMTNRTIKLYVCGQDKADALEQILPAEKEFGSMKVFIEIIPANIESTDNVYLYRKAFEGNPAFSFSTTIEGAFNNPVTFFVFKNKVVQFFNDNLGDIYGNTSTLYQDIADEVFEKHEGIFFCTDKAEE